jgi:hypothetical protein
MFESSSLTLPTRSAASSAAGAVRVGETTCVCEGPPPPAAATLLCSACGTKLALCAGTCAAQYG